MADTNRAFHPLHVVLTENIAHQPLAFSLAEFSTTAGHDAGRILSAMLQHRQRVVDIRGNITLPNQTNQSTHQAVTSKAFTH